MLQSSANAQDISAITRSAYVDLDGPHAARRRASDRSILTALVYEDGTRLCSSCWVESLKL